MHYLDDRELKELLQLRQPPLGHLGTINNYRGVLGYCQLDGPYAVNKGVRTRGSERYSHNRRRRDTLKDGARCTSVVTYSYGGETLRWFISAPARLIRV